MNARYTPGAAEEAALALYEGLSQHVQQANVVKERDSVEPEWAVDIEALQMAARSRPRAERISPKLIFPSAFANRLPFNWEGRAFAKLKADIKTRGGNDVPILVRPIVTADGPTKYEIAAGHRRHRACLDLELDVLCHVQQLGDEELVVRMAAENRGRSDLCPYEKGLHYKRLVANGIFASHRELAEALQMDHSLVSKLVRLAELPLEVVKAFKNESLIRVNWAARLHKALEQDRAAVMSRAQTIAARSESLSPKETFTVLVAEHPDFSGPMLYRRWNLNGTDGLPLAVVKIPTEASGEGVEVTFKANAVDHRQLTRALYQVLFGDAPVSDDDIPPECAGSDETPEMAQKWDARR